MKIKDIQKYEKINKIDLPKDTPSEVGVIGTILSHPDYIYKSEYLESHHFYNPELASIYYIVKTLQEKGIKKIDNFLIITEIEGNKSIKSIIDDFHSISKDINGWLDDLKLVSRNDLESYELICKKIISNAFKRDTYIKLRELSNSIIVSKEDINAINYKMQEDITNFANKYIINTDIYLIGDKMNELWETITGRRNVSGYAGIPSKFKDLNEYFTYENGELVVVGGRAKSGKSMFFLNEAIHKVENGVPSAIFDTEMNDERWIVRFLALKSGVEIKKIKNGNYNKDEESKIKDAMRWIENKPLVHLYDPEWTKDKIYMCGKKLKQSTNLGFLIYDYIKVNDTSKGDNKEHNVLGDMTNFLKNKIAGTFDIPVLSGGQMSPKEMRLADSDKINRYASTIAYWIQKNKEEIVNDGADCGNCKFVIDYNRNGEQMDDDEYLNFRFNGNTATVEQAKKFYKIQNDLPY